MMSYFRGGPKGELYLEAHQFWQAWPPRKAVGFQALPLQMDMAQVDEFRPFGTSSFMQVA
jgi:hypothetical protein